MRVRSSALLLAGLSAFAIAPIGTAADAPEPGFTPVFNGKNLDGWKTKAAKKDAKSEPLDGKTEAFGGRFKVKDGVLVIDPAVKGDVVIETQKEFGGDVVLKLDFKPLAKCNNDTFLRGIKFDLSPANLKAMKEGDWNTLEIAVAGGKAEYKHNGQSVKTVTKVGAASPFGLRAEFGGMEVKNIRVKDGK